MYFGGRWVPMEVMDTIFVLWAIVALIVGVAFFRVKRSGRSAKGRLEPRSARGKRNKRKKR